MHVLRERTFCALEETDETADDKPKVFLYSHKHICISQSCFLSFEQERFCE
jgi:hypothetical protein